MPAQRKIFRIEQMIPLAAPTAVGSTTADAREQQEILAELKALRVLIAQRTDVAPAERVDLHAETGSVRRVLDRTRSELKSLQAAARRDNGCDRTARELDAVAAGAEHATQQILDAAEAIEDAAGTLAASVKRKQAQALAQDIQEQVIRIFEACNFQDLGGQRIGKVLVTLEAFADHISRMMEICDGAVVSPAQAGAMSGSAATPRNMSKTASVQGPHLAGDAGHASQAEIDRLLAAS
jgi:chemotaxis protein CheZ